MQLSRRLVYRVSADVQIPKGIISTETVIGSDNALLILLCLLLLLFSMDILAIQLADFKNFAWRCLLGSGRVYISCRGTVLHSRRAVFASSSLPYTLVRPSVKTILPLKEPSFFNNSKTRTRYQHICRFGVTDCVLVEHLQLGLVQGSLDHISRPQQCWLMKLFGAAFYAVYSVT